MTKAMVAELVFFAGCPNVDAARRTLRDGLRMAGLPETWKEWDQLDPSSPDRIHGYASPTILIGGQDVSAGSPIAAAGACRIGPLASAESVCAALLREAHNNEA